MGFHKRFIFETEKQIKEKYLKKGHDEFRKEYLKPDALLISNSDTVLFIDYTVSKNKKYRRYKYEICKFLKIIK